MASTRLARELRSLRGQAGLSQEAVAEEMGWNESKLTRIENDKSRVLVRDVKRLLGLYKVEGDAADAMLELARLAREPDWWHQYSGAIPEWFQVYVVLEASASQVFQYEAEFVPGVMQTEDYTRAIMSTAPSADTDDEIADKVKVRAARQARLGGEDALDFWAVLNESVIRRLVGGREVMREQIEHLIELARFRNVTLQVLPFSAGEHGAMHGTFTLLKFRGADDPDKVYMEQQTSCLYVQKADEVDTYRLISDHLRARALDPNQTIEMLRAAAAELA